MTTADENSEREIQQWMEDIAKRREPQKRLIFDKESKKLVAVSSDDPSSDEAMPFTSEEAKRYGGWPDFLTIAASVASVTQVVLMIADMWARKAKGKSVTKGKVAKWDWNEVKEIHVLMTDGNRVQFNSWLTDPIRVKEFLKVFRSSTITPKPVSVTFILDNDSKVQMNISGSQDDDHWLEMFINQLKYKNDQKD